jgi:hypothetical protein
VTEVALNLKPLPEPVREGVKALGQLLTGLAGENLRGLAAYGRVLTEDFSPSTTLVRSVVVLGGIDLLLLDQVRKCGMRLRRRRLQPPLVMTPAYIEQSLDTFPLELLEIQQLHVMVLGTDLFEPLEFDPRDMRLQAERELKSALINLRQGLLASAGKDKLLGSLCREALQLCRRVLRGVLWLRKTACPKRDAAIIEAAAIAMNMRLPGLAETCAGTGRSDFVTFQRFYRDVERLSDYVNGLQT